MASQMFVCLHVWNIVFFIFFVNLKIVFSNEEFYSILGVGRTANNDEIRRAYRRLAREWHPDKNTASDAEENFIKINKAYETLSDPKKREDYDRYGQSGAPNHWQKNDQFFKDSGFMFFDGMPFQFQSNWRHRDFTTLNYFQKTIIPESHKKPYLLQIVSDWCINCAAVEEIWEYTSRELRSLGLGTGRVNQNIDPQLAKQLGIRKLPDFVGVISGRLYHYSGTAVTVRKLKEFVSELFPKNLVSEVTNSSLDSFLHHWHDNKPRALLFTSKTEPPLLLKVVSFKYRDNVGVGYVQLSNPSNIEIMGKFRAESFGPTFAIFKENTSQPDVLVKGSELKSGTLDEVISENLYLNFPRLSSQSMFETLCPPERFLSERSLCVILFTNDSPGLLLGHPLLGMSKDPTWLTKKVRFTYVKQAVQHSFENSIKMTEKTRTVCTGNTMAKKVVILWHVKKKEVKYSWLNRGWCSHKDVARITTMLNEIYSGRAELQMSAVIAELNNEHEKDFLTWLLDIWNDVMYYSFHYFNWSANLSTLLLLITFGVVFIISFLFPSGSEKDANLKPNQDHQNPNTSDVFGLIQLHHNNQHALITKAKQGQLFIVLLSDATSNSQALRSPIIQTFANVSRLYLRENIFTFGWLSLQDNIAWCNEVMKVQTFGEIKPGTVLALNGPKKYLSIFKVARKSEQEQDGGNFLDDSEEEDGVASMVFQEDKRTEKRIAEFLGQQLPGWLEKLYEGMLPRIKFEAWPRMECDK